MPRRTAALLSAIVFLLTPLTALALGARPAAIENAPLAALPGPGWGWFTALPAWAEDRLPHRDTAVRAVDAVSRGVFGEPAPLGGPRPAPAGPVAPGPGVPETGAWPPVVEGRDGWLYLGADTSGACEPTRPPEVVLAGLQRLRAAVESSGRRFLLVVAPDKTTAVPQFLPESWPGEECARAARERFWGATAPAAGVLDLRPPLRDAAERRGAPVYSPLDTHWDAQGGLVLTYSIAGALAPGVSRTWDVRRDREVTWPDDLPPLLGRRSDRVIDGYALAPDGGADRTQRVGGDFRVPLVLRGERVPGTLPGRVRMVADSFTQFAIPYLGAVVPDLTIVHPDTVAADPRAAGRLLAEGDAVVLQVAERSLLAGTWPLLVQPVADGIAAELAAAPL